MVQEFEADGGFGGRVDVERSVGFDGRFAEEKRGGSGASPYAHFGDRSFGDRELGGVYVQAEEVGSLAIAKRGRMTLGDGVGLYEDGLDCFAGGGEDFLRHGF